MDSLNNTPKLKRQLGFGAAIGGSVGLVVSGTAMLSVANVGGTAGDACRTAGVDEDPESVSVRPEWNRLRLVCWQILL